MKKMGKNNKKLYVGIGIIILSIIAIILVKSELSYNENTAIYGNRLEGRDKVEISNETKEHVKSSLSENASKVEVRVAGRIIYIRIKTNGDTSLEAAKDLGNKTLESFSDAEKQYYDIQVLIENDANANQFPIIGYKHHTKEAIVWTKDRAES